MSSKSNSYKIKNKPEKEKLKLKCFDSIDDISAQDWMKLRPINDASNPFIQYAFYQALEHSKSTTIETGWQPFHIGLLDTEKSIKTPELVALMPAYMKSHSQGEYVFDHSWAEAYHRAGGHYYPKLQISTPFTPATCPKMFVGNHENSQSLRLKLSTAAKNVTRSFGCSSAHATFLNEIEAKTFEKKGYLIRHDQQFHWFNQDFQSFDDFLSTLTSRKRKQIKKERAHIANADITIKHLEKETITDEIWDDFYHFYLDTTLKKWGRPYLTKEFFQQIGNIMRNQILLIIAYHNEKPIAGAINFKSNTILYGRNWGAIENHPFLHFEVCYYQAIDYAIKNKLSKVEAGAQGGHKIARGYTPCLTTSAHWIPHKGFREAVKNYLNHERLEVRAHQDILNQHTPFKNTMQE